MTEGASEQGGEFGICYAFWLAWSVCALSLALTALSYLVIGIDLSLDAPIYFYRLEPTTIAIGFTGAIEHFSSEYAIYADPYTKPDHRFSTRKRLGMRQ